MFTWADIVLLTLKIVNIIMGDVDEAKWMQAGKDAEIAKISAAILAKTTAGKAMLEKVNAMSDPEVDAALRGLEPS
jgi:hypothetical protein